jgi:hypothetical protein
MLVQHLSGTAYRWGTYARHHRVLVPDQARVIVPNNTSISVPNWYESYRSEKHCPRSELRSALEESGAGSGP